MFPFILRKSDIMNLPYPENPNDLNLGYAEKIIQEDVLNYYIKSRINSKSSFLNIYAKENELYTFGEVFCNALNPIYEQTNMKWFPEALNLMKRLSLLSFATEKPKDEVLPKIFEEGPASVEKLLYHTTKPECPH